MGAAPVRFALRAAAAVALILVASPALGQNPHDATWDWHGQVRKLRYLITPAVDAFALPGGGPNPRNTDPPVNGQPGIGPPFTLGDAVRRAAATWNAAGTGWTFNEVTEKPCEIEVVMANLMAPPSQGPAGIDGTLARFVRPLGDFHVRRATIEINDKPTWGINPANMDFDPIIVLTHELGHAMRLNDKPGVIGAAGDIMEGTIAPGTHRVNAKTMGPDPNDRRNPSPKDLADATASADDVAKPPMRKNMTVGGTVNDQPVSAQATGGGALSGGIMTMDWIFGSIPAGFSIWGTVVTKASSSGSSFAREVGDAVNLFTVCRGNYSIREVGVFPSGQTIVADVVVSTSGDKISSHTTLSGNVSLPRLVGIQMPDAVWTPGPGPNQFVERVTKHLIREDGGPPIPVETTATYTLASGSLPRTQFRSMSLRVLAADPDPARPATATIEYDSSVYLRDVPGAPGWALGVVSAALAAAGIGAMRRRRAL